MTNINLKKVFIIFALTNFISVFLHVLSHYVPFITKEVDYVLYIAKIVVMIFVYRSMKLLTSKIHGFNKIRFMFKTLIACDLVEIYFVFMSGNASLGIIPIVLAVVYILRIVIEILLYCFLLYDIYNTLHSYEHKDSNGAALKKLIVWCICNFLIGIIFILLINKRQSILLYLIYALFFIRVINEFNMIKMVADVYDKDSCKITSIKEVIVTRITKRDIGKLIIGGAILATTLGARYTYKDFHVKDHMDEDGRIEAGFEYGNGYRFRTDYIFQYASSNLMPEWTGLCDRKYGLYSFTNDKDTGIVYRNEIFYDENGLGYVGDGYFIDENFNVLFDAPDCMKIQKTYRQTALDTFIEWCGYNDKGRFHFALDRPIFVYGGMEGIYNYSKNDYLFFRNGIGCYYSELNDCYGLMTDEGVVLTPPKYRYLRIDYDEAFAFVLDMDYQINILNKNGKELIDDTFGRTDGIHAGDYGAGIIEVEPEYGKFYYINDKGELLSSDYDFRQGRSEGDIFYTTKKDDYQNTYVFGEGGRVLFTSDQYLTYEGYRNSEGKVTCLLVKSKTNGLYGLIDLDGNLISKEWYLLIEYRDGVYNCYLDSEGKELAEEIPVD